MNKAKNAEGVILHGGLNHNDFIQELKTASLWIYPSQVIETSCLVAMEAQASGVPFVSNNFSALSETCSPDAGYIIESTLPNAGDLMIKKSIEVLTNKTLWDELSNNGKHFALTNFDSRQLALEWTDIFREKLNASNN